MVRAHHHRRALPQPPLAQRVEHLAQPVVDHAELGPVVGPDLPALPLAQPPGADRADVIRRPDQQLALPLGVVAPRPGLGRVERLVGIELVDEEHERRATRARSRRAVAQPRRRRPHRLRTRIVRLGAEERPGAVIGTIPGVGPSQPVPPEPPAATCRQRGRADGARVGVGPPRIALVPAHVVPGAEVGVVVLAADLEEVRMIRDQHRRHARPPELRRDGLLPDLYGAPGSPEEVERSAQDVVARRHARQRAGDMGREADRPLAGEPVEVRRLELRPAVAAEHVTVEAVEQQHDDIARPTARLRIARRRRARIGTGGHGVMVRRSRVNAARGRAAACRCRPRPGRRRGGAAPAGSGPPRAARRRRPPPAAPRSGRRR